MRSASRTSVCGAHCDGGGSAEPRPDQAFVEYLVSDSGSLAFVVTSDTIAAVSLGAGRSDLARLVRLARGSLESGHARRADSLWRGSLRRLHRHLIAPIEEAGLLAGRPPCWCRHAELHTGRSLRWST
jgi:hypothetical protein